MVGGGRKLEPQLGKEIHRVFSAAMEFGMALLPSKTLNLGNGNTIDTHFRQGIAHLVQFEWFDNGNNLFHVSPHFQ